MRAEIPFVGDIKYMPAIFAPMGVVRLDSAAANCTDVLKITHVGGEQGLSGSGILTDGWGLGVGELMLFGKETNLGNSWLFLY